MGADRSAGEEVHTPLWRQVLADLRHRLSVGEFENRFPTDRELVDEYSVSRHTVREAVRRLQDEGLVGRKRGMGSYTVGPRYEQHTGTLYSLFRSIEAAGSVQTSTVLVQEEQRNRQAAAVLDLEPDAPLFYLERVRLIDGDPIAHDRVWLPLSMTSPLLEIDFGRTALYDELNRHCDLAPESGVERIRPVVPDRAEAGLLGMEPGMAALEVDRRTRTGGEPLEWRITVVRGDRYLLRSEWEDTTGTVSPRLVPR